MDEDRMKIDLFGIISGLYLYNIFWLAFPIDSWYFFAKSQAVAYSEENE